MDHLEHIETYEKLFDDNRKKYHSITNIRSQQIRIDTDRQIGISKVDLWGIVKQVGDTYVEMKICIGKYDLPNYFLPENYQVYRDDSIVQITYFGSRNDLLKIEIGQVICFSIEVSGKFDFIKKSDSFDIKKGAFYYKKYQKELEEKRHRDAMRLLIIGILATIAFSTIIYFVAKWFSSLF